MRKSRLREEQVIILVGIWVKNKRLPRYFPVAVAGVSQNPE